MNRDTRTFILGFLLVSFSMLMLFIKLDMWNETGYLPVWKWISAGMDIAVIFYGYNKIAKTTD